MSIGIYKGVSIKERFSRNFKKKKGCWEWTGTRLDQGYGKTYGVIMINRVLMRAHRLSFILNKGKIPKGMFVLHRCDNPPCVNPKHLWLGTNKDNMKDMNKKGRQNSQLKNNSEAASRLGKIGGPALVRKMGKGYMKKLAMAGAKARWKK